MRANIYFILSVICCLSACSTSKSIKFDEGIESQKIITVLAEQQKAWNDGDIDAFMKGYWNSDELSFIGKKGVTRGWSNTLTNYKKGYPDAAAMGKLNFEVLELRVLSYDAAYMIGKYTLLRENDSPSGHFNLLWNKINGNWLIVSDHTSG